VPAIVGLGKASEICRNEMHKEKQRIVKLREKLKNGIFNNVDYVYLNGHPAKRLAGNLNISVEFVEGEALILALEDIAVSTGSACSSAKLEPSHVLGALGVREDLAHTSIRFGIGRFNTEEEIDYTIQKFIIAVKKLRELSPLYEMIKKGIDPYSYPYPTRAHGEK
jgi:cysteine desulfurase